MSVSIEMSYYTCRDCGGTYAYTVNYRKGYALGSPCPYCLDREKDRLKAGLRRIAKKRIKVGQSNSAVQRCKEIAKETLEAIYE